ncbi:hypothetical protein [uncultured Tateyamaria sp.]|uniref:hypothetical protein n=1 Tax=uncultured Tateyamaria sp. TaxID=455651 RepID=UPI00262AF165|nr:hypothetical protein [uncultured Tateyamaria sp.]
MPHTLHIVQMYQNGHGPCCNRSTAFAGRRDAAILTYALELCDAEFRILFEYRRQGRFVDNHAMGTPKPFKAWPDGQGVFAVGADTGLGRMNGSRTVIKIMDVKSEAAYRTDDPLRHATADLGGTRSFAAIPKLAWVTLVGPFASIAKPSVFFATPPPG